MDRPISAGRPWPATGMVADGDKPFYGHGAHGRQHPGDDHRHGLCKRSATTVDFGSTPATAVTVNTAGTSITCTSPAGTAGTVDADLVITAGGVSATSAADQFTYTASPTVASVSSTTPGGTYGPGTVITITVTYSEAVTVDTTGGTPTLALNSGGTASYTGGSGGSALMFTYTVGEGDSTSGRGPGLHVDRGLRSTAAPSWIRPRRPRTPTDPAGHRHGRLGETGHHYHALADGSFGPLDDARRDVRAGNGNHDYGDLQRGGHGGYDGARRRWP